MLDNKVSIYCYLISTEIVYNFIYGRDGKGRSKLENLFDSVVIIMVMIIVGLLMVVDWMVWFALVVDVSHVATIAMAVSMVVNMLNAAIREMNLVATLDHLFIGMLLLAKVGTIVVVVDMIGKVVGLGMLVVVVPMVMVVVVIMVVVVVCHHHSHG